VRPSSLTISDSVGHSNRMRFSIHTAPVIDAATPRATAVGDGATSRAVHTKNKTDREAYNGCCPCGHRHSAVCLCVYIDETMRGDSVNGGPGLAITRVLGAS
jgi:hypothetical protein